MNITFWGKPHTSDNFLVITYTLTKLTEAKEYSRKKTLKLCPMKLRQGREAE